MEICVRHPGPFLGKKLTPGNFYSVIEMHMFLVTLIRSFEFALPDNAPKVRRWRPGMLIPVVEGEEYKYKGPRLPLKVTLLKER